MPFLGTIANVIAVIVGSLIGVFFGKKINEDVRASLMTVLGLAVMFVGIAGAVSHLIIIDNGVLTTYGTMMIISLFILQGSITALARVFESILNIGTVINDMSLVGSVLIFCVGVNISFEKKFRVGNMLPSLIIAVLYSVMSFYFNFQI